MSYNVEEIEEIAHSVYDAIFQDQSSVEINGVEYPIKKTSKSKARLVEYDRFTYVEQNPHKSSLWGKEAREGYKILWVMKQKQYLFRIRDGVFVDLRKKYEWLCPNLGLISLLFTKNRYTEISH